MPPPFCRIHWLLKGKSEKIGFGGHPTHPYLITPYVIRILFHNTHNCCSLHVVLSVVLTHQFCKMLQVPSIDKMFFFNVAWNRWGCMLYFKPLLISGWRLWRNIGIWQGRGFRSRNRSRPRACIVLSISLNLWARSILQIMLICLMGLRTHTFTTGLSHPSQWLSLNLLFGDHRRLVILDFRNNL